MTPRRLLRPRAFAQALGIHVSTLYRMVQADEIEPPVRIRGAFGQRGGSVGWTEDYVEAVIQRLTAARDQHFAAIKPAATTKRPRGRPRTPTHAA
jgi:predicted DNA-binding transcriptional regulator AlpA